MNAQSLSEPGLIHSSINTSVEFTENAIEKYSEKLLEAVMKKLQKK